MLKQTLNAAGVDETRMVDLKRLVEVRLAIEIVGRTPYIPHRWSEKSKSMMPGHPEKDELGKDKGARRPEEEAEACVYRLADGRPGLPATAIKAAMVGACRLFPEITMTHAKIKFHVHGEGPEQLVPLTAGEAVLREDTPRNANGNADLRYRYMFVDWRAIPEISYLEGKITANSIVALLDAAGRGGAGDWRPSAPKSATGIYGTWRVLGDEPEREGMIIR